MKTYYMDIILETAEGCSLIGLTGDPFWSVGNNNSAKPISTMPEYSYC